MYVLFLSTINVKIFVNLFIKVLKTALKYIDNLNVYTFKFSVIIKI